MAAPFCAWRQRCHINGMQPTPIAIIIGAIIIAVALFVSQRARYEVASNASGYVRLDTWTGELDVCIPAKSSDGLILSCEPIPAK